MDEKRLRVLFLSSWYPSRVNLLLGVFVKRHAAVLAKVCDVSAIYVCADKEAGIEEGIEEGIYTVRVYYKKVSARIILYSQALKCARYVAAWKKALRLYKNKKGKPDIINSNIVYPVSLIARCLKFKWHVPYVITEHWTGYFPEDGRYKGAIMKFVSKLSVKHANAIVTVSNSLKNRMQVLQLNNRYYTISNVVDDNVFNIDKRAVNKEKYTFIHISSLDDEQKNVSGIIRAFGRLNSSMQGVSLVIVGDGPGRENLEKLAQTLGLSNSVKFVGTKTGVELTELLNEANAFVLFSNYENLPCVMLEAMCCGLPLIGTRVGDVAEYINADNGILIEPKDEKALEDAMKQMVKKRDAYNPAVIRNKIIGKVTPEVIAKQFKEVYENALTNS